MFNNQLASGSALNGIGNAGLTWETTEGYDIGVDVSLFENRIHFLTIITIKKQTVCYTELIFLCNPAFPLSLPISVVLISGVMSLPLIPGTSTGALTWTTNLNVSIPRNIVKKLGTNNAPIGGYQEYWDDNRTAVGMPIGMFYGYINTGVYMTQQEWETQPHNATSMVGTARFADIGGPDGKPDGKIDANDRTWIGNPNPDFLFGITNNLEYKNFDFTVVISGSVGNDIADDAYQSKKISTVYLTLEKV